MLGHRRGQLSPEKITMAMAIEGKNCHDRWNGVRLRHEPHSTKSKEGIHWRFL